MLVCKNVQDFADFLWYKWIIYGEDASNVGHMHVHVHVHVHVCCSCTTRCSAAWAQQLAGSLKFKNASSYNEHLY